MILISFFFCFRKKVYQGDDEEKREIGIKITQISFQMCSNVCGTHKCLKVLPEKKMPGRVCDLFVEDVYVQKKMQSLLVYLNSSTNTQCQKTGFHTAGQKRKSTRGKSGLKIDQKKKRIYRVRENRSDYGFDQNSTQQEKNGLVGSTTANDAGQHLVTSMCFFEHCTLYAHNVTHINSPFFLRLDHQGTIQIAI